jgi:hypothetical protein
LITLPFLVTLLLERRWFVPHRAMQLGLQLVIAVAVYGLGFLWIYKTNQLLRIDDNALLGSEEILPALLQEQM